VTTNSFGSPSRLYQFTFTDIANPELGGTITAVLDGTEGQQIVLRFDARGRGSLRVAHGLIESRTHGFGAQAQQAVLDVLAPAVSGAGIGKEMQDRAPKCTQSTQCVVVAVGRFGHCSCRPAVEDAFAQDAVLRARFL
jgi:hypothetical protein